MFKRSSDATRQSCDLDYMFVCAAQLIDVLVIKWTSFCRVHFNSIAYSVYNRWTIKIKNQIANIYIIKYMLDNAYERSHNFLQLRNCIKATHFRPMMEPLVNWGKNNCSQITRQQLSRSCFGLLETNRWINSLSRQVRNTLCGLKQGSCHYFAFLLWTLTLVRVFHKLCLQVVFSWLNFMDLRSWSCRNCSFTLHAVVCNKKIHYTN